MRFITGILATAVLIVLGVSGCSTTPTVPQDELEESTMGDLEEMAGERPDEVSCAGDLEGTVDEKQRCELTVGPEQLGFTVTVTGVDDDQVEYEVEVDDVEDVRRAP